MIRLEVKHFRLVCAIAEASNITRASEMLCLSQPALSKQLAELEDSLGFALFERTRRAMLLTHDGQAFYAHALRILQDLQALETQLNLQYQGVSGTIRLAIDRVHASAWLAEVMAQFRQTHPQARIELKQVDNLLAALQDGRVDMVIVGEASDDRLMHYTPLVEDEMCALLPSGHQYSDRKFLQPEDLQGADLLYYFDLESSYLYQRYLKPAHIRLGSFQHIQDFPTLLAQVASGAGVTILPRRLLGEYAISERCQLLPIGESGYCFTWYAACRLSQLTPLMRAFLKTLQPLVSCS